MDGVGAEGKSVADLTNIRNCLLGDFVCFISKTKL